MTGWVILGISVCSIIGLSVWWHLSTPKPLKLIGTELINFWLDPELTANKAELERATEHFIAEFGKVAPGCSVSDVYRSLNQSSVFLSKTLQNGKQGLQRGKLCWVVWGGHVTGTALFHEWAHMVDELALRRFDLGHDNAEWWEAVEKVKQSWRA